MTELQTVQTAQRANPETGDLAPWLTKSPLIVQQLGLCVTISGTRDVAQIRLNTNLFPTLKDDVASNLIEITDQSEDAFLAAYSSLKEIASLTKQLSKENGLLDKLEERMTSARSEKDLKGCQTHISRIDSYIERSTKNGSDTQEKFEKFAKLVREVRKAVVNAHSHGNGKLLDAQRNIELKDKEKALQEQVLKGSEIQAKQAAEQYETALKTFNQRSGWLGNSMAWTAGSSAVGATSVGVAAAAATVAAATFATAGIAGVAIVGGLIASAISGDQLSSASKGLNIAEDRLSEKRCAFAALELQIASFEGELKLLESSKKTLEQASTTIATSLGLLNGLVDDIKVLMARFRELNVDMRKLVDAYGAGKGYAEAIQDSIDDGEPPSERDTRDFREQISEMRNVSIIIRCFSSLYADVIQDVIIPGFGQIIDGSNDDILTQNVKQLIANKRSMTNCYVEDSNRKCRVLAQKTAVLMAEEKARVKQLANRYGGSALGR